MKESKIETTIGLCVVSVTRFLMDKLCCNQETAYRKLLTMELYQLLLDKETALFLETNDYLCQACNIEYESGIEALYEFINEENS
ncbi:MAG: hypothetical protein K2P23_01335 [Lachnospiraceae bacterium]|nr:hypothetical protein [Lachnospiraceae bacterium]